MINNWDYHALRMDFSSMFPDNDHPGDIDMVYLCKDNTLILAEIKNKQGKFKDGQRKLLARIINNYKYNGVGLYIQHDKLIQNGDEIVDVSNCYVYEIYLKHEKKWRKPKGFFTVKEVLQYYRERCRK